MISTAIGSESSSRRAQCKTCRADYERKCAARRNRIAASANGSAAEEEPGIPTPSAGLTFDQLARRAEDDFQRQALAVVIREELRDGRVRLDGERYVLVHEAFPPGVLEAVAELERFA